MGMYTYTITFIDPPAEDGPGSTIVGDGEVDTDTPGTYLVKYTVTATGPEPKSATPPLNLEDSTPKETSITEIVTVKIPVLPASDLLDSTNLNGASSVANATINGKPYAIVASSDSSSISIINMTVPQFPHFVSALSPGSEENFDLSGASSVRTITIDGVPYAIVAGTLADQISVIDISDPENPEFVKSVGTDGGASPQHLELVSIGQKHYALAVLPDANKVQIVNMTNPVNSYTLLISLSTGTGSDPSSVATATINGKPYAAVTTQDSSGTLLLFDLSDMTLPETADADASVSGIDSPSSVATATVNGKPYAIVASSDSSTISIINMTNPATIEPNVVSVVTDGTDFEALGGASSVATANVYGVPYAIVSSATDNGLQFIDLSKPAFPGPAAAAFDGSGNFETLETPGEIAVTQINGKHFAIVPSSSGTAGNDGVQLVAFAPLDHTAPTVTSAVTTGQTTVEITMSEPVTFANVPVKWTEQFFVTDINENSLVKDDTTTNGWNAGAISAQHIPAGTAGYVTATTDETSTFKAFGLSNGDTNQDISDIDYAIWLTGAGEVRIWEYGADQFIPYTETYNAGDAFRVAVDESGTVTYYHNNVHIYTSSTPATADLIVDTAFDTVGATLTDVRITGSNLFGTDSGFAFAGIENSPTVTSVTASKDRTTLTLELSGNMLRSDNAISLSYTKDQGRINDDVDGLGNDLANFVGIPVTNNLDTLTVLSAATASPTTIDLTMSEIVYEIDGPVTGFTVSGVTGDPSVDSVAIAGDKVTLTLSSNIASTDNNIFVSYTLGQGSINGADDGTGKYLANFAGIPVTNNLAPTFTVNGHNSDFYTIVALGEPYTQGTVEDMAPPTGTLDVIGADNVKTTMLGTYIVTYTVTDSNSKSTTITETVTVSLPVSAVNSISASADNLLGGAASAAAITIGNTPYAVVVSDADNALSIIDMTLPGSPVFVSSVSSSTTANPIHGLDEPSSVKTATIDGKPYAIVTGFSEALSSNTITVIDLSDPQIPAFVTSVKTTGDIYPQHLELMSIGQKHYALAVLPENNSVQIVNMTNPDMPVVENIHPLLFVTDPSDPASQSTAPSSVATATIDGVPYAIVASQGGGSSNNDNQLLLFDLSDPALPATSDADASVSGIDSPSSVATATVNGKPYAIVASSANNSISIINMTNPTAIEPDVVSVITDDGDLALGSASSVATATINGVPYAIVSSATDNGLQFIDLSDPAVPRPAGNAVNDSNGFDKLETPGEIAVTQINGKHFAIVPSTDDLGSGDGVQIVGLELPDFVPPHITSAVTASPTEIEITMSEPVFANSTMAWENAAGVEITGNTITKTESTFGWNAGATSTKSIPANTAGYATAQTHETDKIKIFGLSDTAPSPNLSLDDINYGIYLSHGGGVFIYENGLPITDGSNQTPLPFGIYDTDSVFKIAVDKDKTIRYYLNDVEIRTLQYSENLPLFVYSMFEDTDATLYDVQLVNSDTHASGNFELSGIGSSPTVTSTIISDDRITLYLSDSIASTDDPAVSYEQSSGDLIVDSASNHVLPFGEFSITNTSPPTVVSATVVDATTVELTISEPVTIVNATVVWTKPVDIQIDGDTITKTGDTEGGWDAGASSTQSIPKNTAGYVTAKAGEIGKSKIFGFSINDDNQNYNTIDYGLNLNVDNEIRIYENGAEQTYSPSGYDSYTTDDVFKVAVDESGTVKYYKNNVLFYTSLTPATDDLIVDTSFHHLGATLTDVRITESNLSNSASGFTLTGITGSPSVSSVAANGDRVTLTLDGGSISSADNAISLSYAKDHVGIIGSNDVNLASFVGYSVTNNLAPTVTSAATVEKNTVELTMSEPVIFENTMPVTWTNLSANIEANGNSLERSGSVGEWNGASSVQKLLVDPNTGFTSTGYVTAKVADNNTSKIFGFSIDDDDHDYDTIDYGLNLNLDGNVYIYEYGVLREIPIRSYADVDTFKVAVGESGTVTYYHNNVPIYTSSIPATTDLMVDTSLWNPGTTLTDVRITETDLSSSASGFTLTGITGNPSISSAETSGDRVTLTLDGDISPGDGDISLHYADGQETSIADSDGNKLADISEMPVTNNLEPEFTVDGRNSDFYTAVELGGQYAKGNINVVYPDSGFTTATVGDGEVDTDTPGTYLVKYTVTATGPEPKSATITEIVTVKIPVLPASDLLDSGNTLNGASSVANATINGQAIRHSRII